MFKRLLPSALIGYLLLVIVNWGCTKLDTTTLGSDLIPVVDNVNTFADTLDIMTTQGFFNDTFKISRSETNVLGVITNDPLFGSTQANMFFQFKPSNFPFYYGNVGDTIAPTVDSIVLCLAYTGAWGDTSIPQTLEVYKISEEHFSDSPLVYRSVQYQPATVGGPVGTKIVEISKLKEIIRLRNDSVVNQIRIKLDPTFAQAFYSRDTALFRTDSLYRRNDNGFAVKATGAGKALMYISLTDVKTRLEVHFKKKRVNTGVLDTVVNNLVINTSNLVTNRSSATSNYIKRDYSNGLITTAPSLQQLYLMTGPGTYANLRIPELDTMGNRVIHRAEIYMEQDRDLISPPLTDSIFSAPPYMYVDLVDTPNVKWKPIYYDLNPNDNYDPDLKSSAYFYPQSGIDFSYFGGYARSRVNYLGEKVTYYTINATRHVQRLVTKDVAVNSQLRLFPAYSLSYPQYAGSSPFAFGNPVANGRVRLKSGSYPDPLRKMRMVIIWSKIN